MELIQGVDVNFVMPCMLPGHVSKGPFHSYGVRRHLVNRARNYVLHKNKEKLFSIFPAPYPRKSSTGPLQSTPHPLAQMTGLVPVVARGIVTGLTNCTVHQWQFSSIRSPFSLASSRCVPPLSCFFSVLTEIFDLEEIHNDRSRLWAFFLALILHHEKSLRLGKNSIILP